MIESEQATLSAPSSAAGPELSPGRIIWEKRKRVYTYLAADDSHTGAPAFVVKLLYGYLTSTLSVVYLFIHLFICLCTKCVGK